MTVFQLFYDIKLNTFKFKVLANIPAVFMMQSPKCYSREEATQLQHQLNFSQSTTAERFVSNNPDFPKFRFHNTTFRWIIVLKFKVLTKFRDCVGKKIEFETKSKHSSAAGDWL